jgi:hypothetical protein
MKGEATITRKEDLTDPDRQAATDFITTFEQDGQIITSIFFPETDCSVEIVQRGSELVARLQLHTLDD